MIKDEPSDSLESHSNDGNDPLDYDDELNSVENDDNAVPTKGQDTKKVITFSVPELKTIMYKLDGAWHFYTPFSPVKLDNMARYTVLMKQKLGKLLNIKCVKTKESFKKTSVSRIGYFECVHGERIMVKCPSVSFRGDQELSFNVTFKCKMCQSSTESPAEVDEPKKPPRKITKRSSKSEQEYEQRYSCTDSNESTVEEEPTPDKSEDDITRNFVGYLSAQCQQIITNAFQKIANDHPPHQQLKEFLAEAPYTGLMINNFIVKEAKDLQIRTQRTPQHQTTRKRKQNGELSFANSFTNNEGSSNTFYS